MSSKEQLESIFKTAIHFADPAELLQERLKKIPQGKSLFVVGAGKAVAPMAAKMEEFFLDRIQAGVVVTKDGYGLALQKIECLEAGHPNPDSRSEKGGKRVLEILQNLKSDDVVVALISGGASSLWALPKTGSIEDWAKENEKLLSSGKSIQEVNRLRREKLVLANGGLARAAAPAKVVSFILSDVMGNDLASIGSGPTIVGETESARVQNYLIGDNSLALGGAAQASKRFNLSPQLLTQPILGEAAEAGKQFAKQLLASNSGTVLLGGGETTVPLGQENGRGGRCQEAALAAAIELQGATGVFLLFAGTDGGDGPTDAAGAFADGTTIERAKRKGLDAQNSLQRHDSYSFFEQLGDLFKPGPTRTNVADLWVGIRI